MEKAALTLQCIDCALQVKYFINASPMYRWRRNVHFVQLNSALFMHLPSFFKASMWSQITYREQSNTCTLDIQYMLRCIQAFIWVWGGRICFIYILKNQFMQIRFAAVACVWCHSSQKEQHLFFSCHSNIFAKKNLTIRS